MVIGDVHPGDNPLGQALFGGRYPGSIVEEIHNEMGRTIPHLLPPWAPGMGVDARGVPMTSESDTHVALMPGTRAPRPRRTWLAHELMIDGDVVVDNSDELHESMVDVFSLPIFVTSVRTFELLPEDEHSPRLEIGRTVLRRETSVSAPLVIS